MNKEIISKQNGHKRCRNQRNRFKVLPVLLAAVLCISGNSVMAAAGDNVTKEEVVYASLAADGQVGEIYVVNAFNLPQASAITDYGEYDLLENLTNTKDIKYEGSKVSIDAEKGRVYYQGNMVSKELPWNIQIKYTLDGKNVKQDELAGASGKVGITILTSPNSKAERLFYEKYMLQVTVTLDTSICQNIQAKGATLANAGADKQITFTVMPETEGDMEVSTDAEAFAMKGISIAAVPFSASADMLDVTEIDKLTVGLGQLGEGISELNKGAKQLKSGTSALWSGTSELKSGVEQFSLGVTELKEGAGSISNGAASLTAGSGEFRDGLDQAASVSGEMLAGSGQINEAMQILKEGAAKLGELDLTQLQMLPDGLNALADGLGQMQSGYSGLFQALDTTMNANPVSPISETELYAAQQELQGVSPETQAVFGKLVDNYTSAITIAGTYHAMKENFGELQSGLALLIQNMQGMAGQLEAMKAVDPDSLKHFGEGMATLADQYAGFHQGLAQYMDGIQALSGGYAEIHSGISGLQEGTTSLYGGIIQTADGASGLLKGADRLDSGARELADGVGQLAGGLDTLNGETEKMPGEIKKSIDDMIGKYTNTDFTPVSFTSAKNDNVEAVQFVLATEGIEKTEEPKEETKEEKKESVWEKFLGLFK